ncbi:hypothetical protein ALC62_10243 [Cyphomyrmex costatus]|uniref:DNA-directed DNA polymerase n=1 Tax=Cyphomyrmex costatus TaxID=456900 RepID=A0A151IEB5_9HYME|nr:hypothetical protein ALC62_10243 [Cyphomyrmex costatus]
MEIETAFNNRVLTGAVVNSNYIDPRHFFKDARDIVIPQIRSNLQKHACLKVNTMFNGEFVVDDKRSIKSIATKNHDLYAISDLKKWYDKYVMDEILIGLEEFQERESGWVLSRILTLIVNVNKYYPMHCGCFVKLPRRIILKRATVNVHSFDNACFAWSIVAALYPASNNVNRTSQYPHYLEVLRFEDITFPVTLKQITKFEHLNDISVNVFVERETKRKRETERKRSTVNVTMKRKRNTVDDTMIVPLRVTKVKRNIHVNLLYVQHQQHDDNGVGHFVLIKDLSRLLSSQLSGNSSKKYICDRCLHYFNTRDKLSSHDVDCARMNKCTVLLPNENDKWLSFRNYNRKKRLPLVVYADLECILEKTGIDDDHDVLLLADVFENFRDTCMVTYGLDPVYYVTLPSYTWDAMLKNTGVRFELLTDIDMVLFIERGIRGGLSQCSHRYARANNVCVPTFDPSKPISYLMYFDVNNLYGWAMMEPLPYGEFHWVDNVDGFDVMSVPVDSDVGYILEVDLTYPHVLHDSHYDLPFCPTKELPSGGKYEKLLATLNGKERYVIHYRNLQQCIRHGLVVTKIHRILQFAQSRWLRGYIEVNTRLRMLSNNDFERNLYKLMNNAVFGKTVENVRDYKDVRLVTVWDGRYGLEAMIAKPNFCSRSIFSENLVAVELRKLEVTMNKPIYVGMCILEISKIRLYDFHYEHMVPLYRDKCTLMYTDTNSLIYFLKCVNAYEDIKRNITKFDTSDYPEDNVYGIPRLNNKIPGLMKDENNGAVMTEFIGLRAKMYALRVVGMSDVKKIKDF